MLDITNGVGVLQVKLGRKTSTVIVSAEDLAKPNEWLANTFSQLQQTSDANTIKSVVLYFNKLEFAVNLTTGKVSKKKGDILTVVELLQKTKALDKYISPADEEIEDSYELIKTIIYGLVTDLKFINGDDRKKSRMIRKDVKFFADVELDDDEYLMWDIQTWIEAEFGIEGDDDDDDDD